MLIIHKPPFPNRQYLIWQWITQRFQSGRRGLFSTNSVLIWKHLLVWILFGLVLLSQRTKYSSPEKLVRSINLQILVALNSLEPFYSIKTFFLPKKERMISMTDSFCTWLFVRPLLFFLLTSSDWKATVIMAIKTFRKKKGAIAMYTMKKMEMPGLLFFLGPWSTPTLDTAESRILQ